MEAIRDNPKYFYTYANRRYRTRLAVRPFVVAGELVGGREEMANALAIHYQEDYAVPRFPDVSQSRAGRE